MRETARKVYVITEAHWFSLETPIWIADTQSTAEQLIMMAYPKAERKEEGVYMNGRSIEHQIYIRDTHVVTDGKTGTNTDEVYMVTSVITNDPGDTETVAMIADTKEAAVKKIKQDYGRAWNGTLYENGDGTFTAVYNNSKGNITTVGIRIQKIQVFHSVVRYIKPA